MTNAPKQKLIEAETAVEHAHGSIADIDAEIAHLKEQRKVANSVLVAANSERATAHWDYKLNKLKGNPALFIRIEALSEFAKDLPQHEQERLQSAIDALSPRYQYLGEFIFENPKRGPDRLDGQPVEGFDIVIDIMKANGFEHGYMNNYNQRSALETIQKTPLPRKYGTGRRDLIREHLMDMFGTRALKAGLKVNTPAQLTKTRQNTESLVITFNVPANAKKYFDKTRGKNHPNLANTLDYGLKRAVTRAYLESKQEDRPTNSAMEEYDCIGRSVKVVEDKGAIKVTIPLDQEFYARMSAGRLDMTKLEGNISGLVAVGLSTARRAKHLKQTPA